MSTPENQTQFPQVKISNPHKWHPAIIIDHEGADYVFGLPIAYVRGREIKRYVIRMSTESSYYHIHTLKMSFLLMVNANELSSNTGNHQLLINTYKCSMYQNDNNLEFHGAYKLKKVIKFKRGFRPPKEVFDNIPLRIPSIAWAVREGIDEIWFLEQVNYRETTVILPEQLKLEQLQGHLQYSKIKLVMGEYDIEYAKNIPYEYMDVDFRLMLLPMFKYGKPRFFNHQPKQPIYWLPLPYVYSQPSWLVVVINQEVGITSSDHLPATLQPGAYILTHPKPQPQSQGGAGVD